MTSKKNDKKQNKTKTSIEAKKHHAPYSDRTPGEKQETAKDKKHEHMLALTAASDEGRTDEAKNKMAAEGTVVRPKRKSKQKFSKYFRRIRKGVVRGCKFVFMPLTKMSNYIKNHELFQIFFHRLGKITWTILSYVLSLAFLGSIAVAAIAYPIYLDYQSTLPPLSLKKITNRTIANSIVYDKDDKPVNALAEEAFIAVTYDDLPQAFIDAISATEDARFFNHNGIDGPRTIEAVFVNLLRDDITSGGSTITQQLIKMTSLQDRILDKETGQKYKNSNERKAHEMMLAHQLEQLLTKEEILTAYANSIGYGRFVGVGTAAKRYFNKDVSNLTLPEAALLAGIPQSSSSNDPYRYMEEGTERYQTVINLMTRHGYISEEQATALKYIPLSNILLTNQNEFINKNKAYFDSIEAELNDLFNVKVDHEAGESFPYYYTGLKIFSALDIQQQNQADKTMNTEDVVPYSTMLNNLWGNTTDEDSNLQAAFAVINVKNGEIPAIGASRNYDGYNMALHGYRSPGSAIKPLIDYAPGMEKFGWGPLKSFVDDRTYYSGSRNEIFNFTNSVSGKAVTINTAIAQSLNTVAVRAIQEIGVEYAGNFVNNIGITRAGELLAQHDLYESAALGGGLELTPVQMAGAYAAFANAGKYNRPHFIRRIENENGDVLYEYKNEPVQMMSPQTAQNITTSLQYARRVGTPAGGGRRQVSNEINFAAKTGTSSYGTDERYAYSLSGSAEKDHWIVGYSPEYSIAVWTGFNIEDGAFLQKTRGNVNANKQYGSYILSDWMNKFAPRRTEFNFNVAATEHISISGIAASIDDINQTITWNKPDVSFPISIPYDERKNYGPIVFDVYVTTNGESNQILTDSEETAKINYGQYTSNQPTEIKIVARLKNNSPLVKQAERTIKLR
jgi:penicillin-binding protein 1A